MIIKELIEELQKAACIVGEFADVETQNINEISTIEGFTLCADGAVLLIRHKSTWFDGAEFAASTAPERSQP